MDPLEARLAALEERNSELAAQLNAACNRLVAMEKQLAALTGERAAQKAPRNPYEEHQREMERQRNEQMRRWLYEPVQPRPLAQFTGTAVADTTGRTYTATIGPTQLTGQVAHTVFIDDLEPAHRP